MNPLKIFRRFSISLRFSAARLTLVQGTIRFAITLFAFAIAAPGAAGAALLEAVVVQESSVYHSPELFDVYKAWLANPVTKQTATAIGEALQEKYRDDGFARPGYRVKDRGTQSGIVRIEVVEASVSRVQMTGQAGPYREELKSLAATLPSQGSLRPEQLRDFLRQARRLPGLEIGLAAAPDEERSGAFVIELDSDWKRLEGSAKLSNRGTEEIGRNILLARLVANGLLDRQIASGLFVTTAERSSNYFGGGLFANMALGGGGHTLRVQAAAASVGFLTQGIRVEQDRERWSAGFRYVQKRSSERELSISGSFGVENLDVEYDAAAVRDERLRTVQLGVARTARGSSSQSLASIELEQGLNAFGGRFDNFLRPDDATDNVFTVARLHYVRVTKLHDAWTLRWDALAQHSTDVLPSIKRFRVGGGRIGRGFEAAAVRGDRGIGNKLELKRRVANNLSWLERAGVYGFYDLGTAWRSDAQGRDSASSAGFGVSLRGKWLSAYVEIAKPLTHADADGRKDSSLFAEITARF